MLGLEVSVGSLFVAALAFVAGVLYLLRRMLGEKSDPDDELGGCGAFMIVLFVSIGGVVFLLSKVNLRPLFESLAWPGQVLLIAILGLVIVGIPFWLAEQVMPDQMPPPPPRGPRPGQSVADFQEEEERRRKEEDEAFRQKLAELSRPRRPRQTSGRGKRQPRKRDVDLPD